jgi:hypothetical protein
MKAPFQVHSSIFASLTGEDTDPNLESSLIIMTVIYKRLCPPSMLSKLRVYDHTGNLNLSPTDKELGPLTKWLAS